MGEKTHRRHVRLRNCALILAYNARLSPLIRENTLGMRLQCPWHAKSGGEHFSEKLRAEARGGAI